MNAQNLSVILRMPPLLSGEARFSGTFGAIGPLSHFVTAPLSREPLRCGTFGAVVTELRGRLMKEKG